MATATFNARAQRFIGAICPEKPREFRINTTPVPAARPRVARNGGVYYPRAYSDFLALCKQQLAAMMPSKEGESDLIVSVEAVIQKPKKTVLARPKGDVDNLSKGPLDAATGLLWPDDGQVTILLTSKRWAEPGETPHIHMIVGRAN